MNGRARFRTALPFMLLLCAAACDRGAKRPDLIYRVDAAVRGWVVIVFDQPAAPALPMAGDACVIDVPRSGVLVTSTRQWVGRGHDIFRTRGDDGREAVLSSDLVRAHRTGVRTAEGRSIDYELFFIGTKAELEAAESDDAALSRALANVQ